MVESNAKIEAELITKESMSDRNPAGMIITFPVTWALYFGILTDSELQLKEIVPTEAAITDSVVKKEGWMGSYHMSIFLFLRNAR